MKESVIKELFGEAISYAEKMRVDDEEYYRQLEVAEIRLSLSGFGAAGAERGTYRYMGTEKEEIP